SQGGLRCRRIPRFLDSEDIGSSQPARWHCRIRPPRSVAVALDTSFLPKDRRRQSVCTIAWKGIEDILALFLPIRLPSYSGRDGHPWVAPPPGSPLPGARLLDTRPIRCFHSRHAPLVGPLSCSDLVLAFILLENHIIRPGRIGSEPLGHEAVGRPAI